MPLLPQLAVFAGSLALAATTAFADPSLEGETYATVKGWTVVQNDLGCSAYNGDVSVIFNTPPSGGWQLIFPYNVPGVAADVEGTVDVDRYSFADVFYGDGTWYYGSFPLEMRRTVGQASRLHAEIGEMIWDAELTGSTAALLKVEECWARMTDWSAATSSRAGTFAFSGD